MGSLVNVLSGMTSIDEGLLKGLCNLYQKYPNFALSADVYSKDDIDIIFNISPSKLQKISKQLKELIKNYQSVSAVLVSTFLNQDYVVFTGTIDFKKFVLATSLSANYLSANYINVDELTANYINVNNSLSATEIYSTSLTNRFSWLGY